MLDYAELQPGGRLSFVEGNPEIVPIESARSVFYSPFLSPVVPIFNGIGFERHLIPGPLRNDYSDTTKNPAMADGTCADLFVWNDDGVIRLGRGASWPYTGVGRVPGLTRIAPFPWRVNSGAIANGPAAQRGTWVGTIANWTEGMSYVRPSWAGVAAINHVWNAYNKKLTVCRVTQGVAMAGGGVSGWSFSSVGIYVVVGEMTAIQIQGGVQTNVDVHIIIMTRHFTAAGNPGVGDDLGVQSGHLGSGITRGLTRSRFIENDPHAYTEAGFMFGPGMSDFELWTHGNPRTLDAARVNPLSAMWRG